MNSYKFRFFGLFRLFLAALVMVQHFAANVAPTAIMTTLQPYEVGTLAVLAFFCLSGFVISESADAAYSNRPTAFLANRCLRIFPHFAIAVLISVLLQYILYRHGLLRIDREASALPVTAFALRNIAANIAMLFPFFSATRSHSFIPIAWAVRVEVIFYLTVYAALASSKFNPLCTRLSFRTIAAYLTICITPVFILSIFQKGPTTAGYLPYFVFGSSLYFHQTGVRPARFFLAASIFGMLLHFFSLPPEHPVYGFHRNGIAQFMLLFSLILGMSSLAYVRLERCQAIDNALGSYTYPLYLYHFVVLIAVASLWPQNTLSIFMAGLALSVIFSFGMAKLIDPLIDRTRNRIRGWAIS